MRFFSDLFLAKRPEADLARDARGHREQRHQPRDFLRLCHVRRFKIEAARFQRREQRLYFPALAVNRQRPRRTRTAGNRQKLARL